MSPCAGTKSEPHRQDSAAREERIPTLSPGDKAKSWGRRARLGMPLKEAGLEGLEAAGWAQMALGVEVAGENQASLGVEVAGRRQGALGVEAAGRRQGALGVEAAGRRQGALGKEAAGKKQGH